MNPLAKFFADNPDIRKVAFARTVGVTPGRITQLCDGDTPSLPLAQRIEAATRKQVPVSAWPHAKPVTSEARVA
jgi:hypothetical protein